MKFLLKSTCFTIAAAIMLSASTASAQFFTDGFDDIASWTEARDADTTLAVVDYSLDGIPEAPNMVAGSGATTGVKISANALGSAAKANLIGAIGGGNADLALSTYQVSFDVWMNTSNPLPSNGSTEQVLYGVGRTTTTPIGRPNRTSDGDGVWGWLAVENGYGSEDTVLRSGTAFADSKSDGANPGRYNETFARTLPTDNAAAGNQWVTVTLAVDAGNVDVYYNDRLFLSGSGVTAGDVMVGYEDPFGSIGSAPADQFAIIDNVVIDDAITITPVIPEPTSLALLGLGGLALLARRR